MFHHPVGTGQVGVSQVGIGQVGTGQVGVGQAAPIRPARDRLASSRGYGDGYSDEQIGIASPPPADPTTYSHQGCGAPLERMQRHCGGCGQEIEWAGLS